MDVTRLKYSWSDWSQWSHYDNRNVYAHLEIVCQCLQEHEGITRLVFSNQGLCVVCGQYANEPASVHTIIQKVRHMKGEENIFCLSQLEGKNREGETCIIHRHNLLLIDPCARHSPPSPLQLIWQPHWINAGKLCKRGIFSSVRCIDHCSLRRASN